MMNSMQAALIKKDIRSITSNKRMFSVLLIIPLVMALVLPTIFILTIAFIPEQDNDMQALLELLPQSMLELGVERALVEMLMNNIIPMFFLMIPIMAASVMAASSFVGEKEKRTLETLLYCPLTLRQIFNAKIFASFLLSMFVSLLSFIAMIAVVELEMWLIFGELFAPGATWIALMLLVAPAISIIAITMIVKGSAKAQTMEESQQRSVFLILPILLLAGGQFSGVLLVNGWLMLAIGVVLMALAVWLLRGSFKKFRYETLLK